jgi:iron complex transport system substrate-binding protein
MKHNVRKLIILLLLALLLTLSSCTPRKEIAEPGSGVPGETPQSGEASDRLTVTDLLLRQVKVPEKVERIVSLTSSNTETLYAIGAGERIAGRDEYSYYPEEAKQIPVVGGYNGPNIEAIVASDADVVFASTKLQRDVIDKLESAGICVVASEAGTFEDIPKSIELIASVCGLKQNGEDLVASMRERIEAVAARADSENKPSVYFIMSYGDQGDWTSGPGSFINSMIELAGGECVTADGPVPWINYSMEQLVERDPDILLLSSYFTVDEIKEANGYRELTAVRNGNVYTVDADLISRPGPRIVESLESIADIIAGYKAALKNE